jgi:hypothetical protein
MKYHDIDCTQFRLCSAMETRSCTVGGVITAVRWKETTPVATGCIWKCKKIPKSRYEAHMPSSNYSYHDAVQRTANTSHTPPLHSCVVEVLNVGIVFRQSRFWAEKVNNYWLLLILIFVFTLCIKTLFYLVDFNCLCQNWGFICYNREVFFERNQNCRWNNSPNSVSVQLYEQHNVTDSIQLYVQHTAAVSV